MIATWKQELRGILRIFNVSFVGSGVCLSLKAPLSDGVVIEQPHDTFGYPSQRTSGPRRRWPQIPDGELTERNPQTKC